MLIEIKFDSFEINTCFKLNIRVLEIVIGQYFVCRSNLDLIFSAGPSLLLLVLRFKGTSTLFRISLPKSCNKQRIKCISNQEAFGEKF